MQTEGFGEGEICSHRQCSEWHLRRGGRSEMSAVVGAGTKWGEPLVLVSPSPAGPTCHVLLLPPLTPLENGCGGRCGSRAPVRKNCVGLPGGWARTGALCCWDSQMFEESWSAAVWADFFPGLLEPLSWWGVCEQGSPSVKGDLSLSPGARLCVEVSSVIRGCSCA